MIDDEPKRMRGCAETPPFVELLARGLRELGLDPEPVIAATRYDGADGGIRSWLSFTTEMPNGLHRVIRLYRDAIRRRRGPEPSWPAISQS